MTIQENMNTGDQNTGYRNTGNRNTGNRNTWYLNTGHRNTGNRNTGNRNTGYLNSGNPKVVIFDVQTDIEYGEISFPDYFSYDTVIWISEKDMTDKEKEANPSYKTTEWYLKKLSESEDKDEYMKDCRRISFNKADKEDIAKTLELPHFDYKKFENISWISKEDLDKKLGRGDVEELTVEEISKRLGKTIKVVR